MKKVVYEVFFFYTPGKHFVNMLRETMAGKVELQPRQGKEPVDITFVDSTYSIHRAHGLVLFISGELAVRNPRLMDYSMLLTRSSSPRHYRTYRTLFMYDRGEFEQQRERYRQKPKNKFCSFISSHPTPHRNRFVKQLSAKKRVDCAGYCLKNTDMGSADKTEFMSRYKFNVCFEHTAHPGYVTEKIHHALSAGTVPIYFGAADIARDFNPQAFIDVGSFPNYQAAIDWIIEVDQNPALYESYLQADPVMPDSFLAQDTDTKIRNFYTQAIEKAAESNAAVTPLSTRLYRYCYAPISFLHVLATHHHVDGLALHQLLLDWRGWGRVPLTVVEKLWHFRNKRKHRAIHLSVW